jgi:RND family efflux transporter MFP subunit
MKFISGAAKFKIIGIILLGAGFFLPIRPAHSAIPFSAGSYRGQMWSDPAVVPMGKADLYFHITDESGKPLSDVQAKNLTQMPGMPMGENTVTLESVPDQPGLYKAAAQFGMEGGYVSTTDFSGPKGAAKAEIPLKTGQDTGGAPSQSKKKAFPWGNALIGGAAFLFLAYFVSRLRKTGQRVKLASLVNRSTIPEILMLLVLFAGSIYAVNHFRRPGAMTPIEAQAMSMETPAPPGYAPVVLSTATRGRFSSSVRYSGAVVGYNEQEIYPRVNGWITWMPFYAGDRVKKGQLLVRLDTRELQAKEDQQRANRMMAERSAMIARIEHQGSLAEAERSKSEVESKAGALEEARRMRDKAGAMIAESQSNLTQARSEAKASQAELAAARSDGDEAEAMLQSAKAALPEAQAAVTAAKADQDYWTSEIAREKNLLDKGAVSGEEYQREQSQAAAAAAKLRQAQSQLVAAKSGVQAAQSRLAKSKAMIESATEKASQALAEAQSAESRVAQAQADADAQAGRVRMAQGELSAAKSAAQAMSAAASADEGKIGLSDAGLAEADASLSAAEIVKGYAEIRSSSEGVVTERLISPGVLVNPGQAILKVAQIRPIRIQANVPESDLAKIRVGDPVQILSEKRKGGALVAKVSSVTPSVDPTTRMGVVEAVVPNDDSRFLPGEFVTMAISTGEASDALRVPSSAIQWQAQDDGGIQASGAKPYVWVAEPKAGETNRYAAQPKAVEIGGRDGEFVEILSGLKEGDPVIVDGQQNLHPGDLVAATEGDAEETGADSSDLPDDAAPMKDMPGMKMDAKREDGGKR